MQTNIKEKLKSVPKQPGCYLWKNKYGNVIYVGKAKNLFNRTHQYFLKPNNNKTYRLVQEIADLDFIIVKNENEALILESNLIKKYKPKYNILLRDNNGYPYILVTNETKPRLLYTHEYHPKKGKYYGPFATADMKAYDIYALLLKLFPLKKCNSQNNRKCFYYDMNMCIGSCVNEDTPQKYEELKRKIDNFFTKGSKEIVDELKKKEKMASDRLDFESAKQYLELQKSIDLIVQKQIINLNTKADVDVVGFAADNNYLSIVIFSYVNGKLLNKDTVTQSFVGTLNEELSTYLFQYYSHNKKPKILYGSLDSETIELLSNSLDIKIQNPQKGKMHQIITLAAKNAMNQNKVKLTTKLAKEERTIKANQHLGELLNIKNLYRIELFDNSNIFNTDPVSAMVVYENGEPNKKEYRKYKIKLEEASSDYEYMYEVIYRRYWRLINEKKSLPDLIIVDGGKIQISAAKKALTTLRIANQVNLIGLAKNSNHKTDYIETSDGKVINLDKQSNLYFFLLNMQEEVHRFAISFFRQTNRKSSFTSILDGIKNLGKNRKIKLLNTFGTISKIKSATLEELSQVVPENVAIAIQEKLKRMD